MIPAVFGQEGSLTVPRVMMVEDEQLVGEAFRRGLEKAGLQVCWAMSGAEAVSLKESFKPEIVLVDLELPDVNGVDLIRWLVSTKDCGVIVVSGAGDETDRDRRPRTRRRRLHLETPGHARDDRPHPCGPP